TTIKVWETQSGNLMHTIESSALIVTMIPLVDLPLIALGDHNFGISIWNITTGHQAYGPYICHTNTITTLCTLSSHGKQQIVSGGKDGTLRIWQIDPNILSSELSPFLNLGTEGQKVQFLECDHNDIMSSKLFITPSGWLVSQKQLILWIPPWYRQSLVCPQVLCLPASVPNQCLKVDWSRFVHGTNWLQI
ncbi:hypothetical protein BDN72DRAFT_745128, partial [Pluteus cervinus]